MVAWNARRYLDDHLLLWLGIWSLFAAILDVLHILAAGVGVLPGVTHAATTQLWVAAQLLQAIALVGAPHYLTRRLDPNLVLTVAAGLTALAALAILHWRVVPGPPAGTADLAPFTLGVQLLACGLLGTAIWRLVRKRHLLHPDVYRLLGASTAILLVSDLLFAVDPRTRGPANLLAQLFRILAFYGVYKATIETAFVKPYALLFRSLRQSEEELRRALSEVKQLSGMLPICSSCKQIRNDQGYWQEVEVYLTEHSEAQFSHGLCPECAHRLYPEYFPAPPRS